MKPQPPRQGVRTEAERTAERLAIGKRALVLFRDGVPMTAICTRMGRSDSYVRQGMKEAK